MHSSANVMSGCPAWAVGDPSYLLKEECGFVTVKKFGGLKYV